METKVAAYLEIAKSYQTMPYAEIRSGVAGILAGMSVAELKAFAGLCNVGLYKANKATMQESFAREICENKCSFERCQFTFGAK